jgi:acyl-homoserine-lactone acylase
MRATLYRDTYGVPHIYAESEVAAAYVHGYAQAEDRLEQILRHYRWAEGTLAEILGKEYLESDYFARAWRHREVSYERYTEIPETCRELIEAFVRGLKAYMEEYPDRVPDWAPEVHPWHVVALLRAFIWDWPTGQALNDLRRGSIQPEAGIHHSNQWAGHPRYTACRPRA